MAYMPPDKLELSLVLNQGFQKASTYGGQDGWVS